MVWATRSTESHFRRLTDFCYNSCLGNYRHSADTAGLRHEKSMNPKPNSEAAETVQTTNVPAVDLPQLVRLCADHGYSVSRDYAALYEMAQSQSVVCFVDYHECRDVACTLVRRGDIEIGARGIGYVWATSKGEFVLQCRRLNVEFIPLPNALSAFAEMRTRK